MYYELCLKPGIPSKGFCSDNVKQFQNKLMNELVGKYGLKVQFGPVMAVVMAYLHWSNSMNEIYHGISDKIWMKAVTSDKKLSQAEVVDLASYVHNTNVNILGYTLMELMIGKNNNITRFYRRKQSNRRKYE